MSLLDKLAAERSQQLHLDQPVWPSMPQARAARDQAIERVDTHAESEWKAQALAAVKATAERLPDLISDDVWETTGLPSTREDRALGPVFQRAAREGYIAKTDRVRPSVRSHLSGKTVWRSLIWKSNEGEAQAA
jgi:hypothetical protein